MHGALCWCCSRQGCLLDSHPRESKRLGPTLAPVGGHGGDSNCHVHFLPVARVLQGCWNRPPPHGSATWVQLGGEGESALPQGLSCSLLGFLLQELPGILRGPREGASSPMSPREGGHRPGGHTSSPSCSGGCSLASVTEPTTLSLQPHWCT